MLRLVSDGAEPDLRSAIAQRRQSLEGLDTSELAALLERHGDAHRSGLWLSTVGLPVISAS